jgi:glycosyltransferase involved in cell wall biosynthesis
MPNISSNLSDKEEHLPEVEVLLATFNGELYLSEFLESLYNQQGVKIHLRVSDDGSTDKTLEIIDLYKSKFASCKISSGPRKGPSANFFSLIEKSSYEYAALADQDDIWLPNHLLLSLSRLHKITDVPSMTFSAVAEFGQELISESVWPKRYPGENVRTILTENLARGCTFVLNSEAINLIKFHRPENAIMHDWWILLLIYSSGNVTWSTLPEVRYRIHQNNAVGGKPIFQIRAKRFFKNVTGHNWKFVHQADELLRSYHWAMHSLNRQEIAAFLQLFTSPGLKSRYSMLMSPIRLRASLVDELAIRIAFLLQPRRKRGPGTMEFFVYNRLKKFFAQSTFFIANFRLPIKSFIDYRITKKFDQYNIVKRVDKLSNNGLAIVALYPRQGILSSATRIIDSLLLSNYSVLVIMNESPSSRAWLEILGNKPIEILTRPNIGRDFGAYKIGFKYAEKNGYLNQIENLLFANDSTLYGPNSINFVKSMLEIKKPWQSMFVNYQFHMHAQSFFQVFNKDIFQRETFSKFWHNYYPSEFRHRTINYGEVLLSSVCIGEGFVPYSFVSAKSILDHPEFREFSVDEKFGIWSDTGFNFSVREFATLENTKLFMQRQYLAVNITHHQGLLASRVLKAPLKLDIFQTGLATLEGIETTLKELGIMGNELIDVMDVMTLKGSHVSKKGFQKLWRFYGYL